MPHLLAAAQSNRNYQPGRTGALSKIKLNEVLLDSAVSLQDKVQNLSRVFLQS